MKSSHSHMLWRTLLAARGWHRRGGALAKVYATTDQRQAAIAAEQAQGVYDKHPNGQQLEIRTLATGIALTIRPTSVEGHHDSDLELARHLDRRLRSYVCPVSALGNREPVYPPN